MSCAPLLKSTSRFQGRSFKSLSIVRLQTTTICILFHGNNKSLSQLVMARRTFLRETAENDEYSFQWGVCLAACNVQQVISNDAAAFFMAMDTFLLYIAYSRDNGLLPCCC